MASYPLTFSADDTIQIPVSSSREAQLLASKLREYSEFEDVIPGLDCVFAIYDPLKMTSDKIEKYVRSIEVLKEAKTLEFKSVLEIPIVYGGKQGPDFNDLCTRLDVSKETFIQSHTSSIYPVEMMGFTPGFAYIGDCPWQAKRLRHPRQRVPAGSVGLAAGYTGIYSLSGPGGWPIIGHTELPLFDRSKDDPFVLAPLSGVQFVSIEP